jgi:hypothetical protein
LLTVTGEMLLLVLTLNPPATLRNHAGERRGRDAAAAR